MTGLRALGRLAVRECRRRPWRSLLVVALIAVPTAAAVFVSIWLRTGVASPQQQVAQQLGRADLVAYGGSDAEIARMKSVVARQPGWRAVEVRQSRGLIGLDAAGSRKARFSVMQVPFRDPLVEGLQAAALRSGRAPGPGEVAVAPALLTKLGVRVGDTFTPIRPRGSFRISGTLRELSDAVVGPDIPADGIGTQLLIDTPSPVGRDQLPDALRDRVQTRADVLASVGGSRKDETIFLYLYGALGLAAFGIVVASALAIGARRQLRALGLLGASGASPRQTRLLILLQGATLGAVGALAGMGLGIGLAYGLRPAVEHLTGRREGAPLQVRVVDCLAMGLFAVVVAIAAAWLPARVASRTSVLHALGGRRPLTALGARMPVAGVAVSSVGCLLLTWAAATNTTHPNRDQLAAVLGAALIITGLVICSPYLVGLLERVSGRTSGTFRLAARTVARQRSRTGPTVAAIMAAGALAIAAATVTLAQDRQNHRVAASDAFGPRPDTVQVQLFASKPDGSAGDIRCEDASSDIVRVSLRTVIGTARTECFSVGFGVVGRDDQTVGVAVIDEAELGAAGVGRYADDLRAGGAVSLDSPAVTGLPVRTELVSTGNPVRRVRVIQGDRPSGDQAGILGGSTLMTPATAARLGVRDTYRQVFLGLRLPGPLNDAQRSALTRLSGSDPGADLSTVDRDVEVNYIFARPQEASDAQLIAYAVILPAAVVLALLTVLIGLALTAAETRDEQATFVAVGAGPGHRRRQNAWQALIVAAIGALLAIPGGLVPVAIVLKASDSDAINPIEVSPPWPMLLGLAVGVPLAAAAGAALLTRARIGPLIRRSV